jgi:ubiquinone biosynthesis protein UbiJ
VLINKVALQLFNQLIEANPNIKQQLAQLAPSIIQLNLSLVSLAFIVSHDGSLVAENSPADCSITITASAINHLVQDNQIKALQQLDIQGDYSIAQSFLQLVAKLDPKNILYQTQNPLLGVVINQLEQLVVNLITYLRLVFNNASYSTSQYLQFETNLITDKFSLEKFYYQVDELKQDYQLLRKRVERLTKQ